MKNKAIFLKAWANATEGDDFSHVINEIGEYLVWFSNGDAMPYWVSNQEGEEIDAFYTKASAEKYADQLMGG